MKKTAILFLAIFICITGITCEKKPQTFDEALALSASEGKPLLLDFFAEWCGPCVRFTKALNEDTDINKALKNVLLYQIDCEKGDGVELSEKYTIKGYPTYILIDSKEQVIDRWMGFEKAYFIETLTETKVDLTTIDEKTSRFAANPNIKDAVVLGRYNSAIGEYINAVNYYTQAQQLNKDDSKDFTFDIFYNTARGIYREQFTYDNAALAAMDVIKNGDSDDKIQTSNIMIRLAKRMDKQDDLAKYINNGLAVSDDSDDPDIQRTHKLLLAAKCLYVTGDTIAAVEYKRDAMFDGWLDTPDGLNEFAWWCFENLTNLEEAEQLAAKAVNLAESGSQKAMILDTHAQILKANGKLEEAITVMEMAVVEEPDNKQWPKTLEIFKTELDSR
ncbi:MAG: thioredoxin family protein [candidate division Zixibacteria bacterium]|nr:thioredoxin family protein [candidate division Zixibacteria bacterium]